MICSEKMLRIYSFEDGLTAAMFRKHAGQMPELRGSHANARLICSHVCVCVSVFAYLLFAAGSLQHPKVMRRPFQMLYSFHVLVESQSEFAAAGPRQLLHEDDP